MAIINQPFQGQLGNILTDAMKQNYNTFTFFSAFAKNSGVLRMKPALEDFKARGGRISAFIGIDLDGTFGLKCGSLPEAQGIFWIYQS